MKNQDDIPLPEVVKAKQDAAKEQETEEKEAIRTQALRDSDLFQLCAIHRLMFAHLDGVALPVPSADLVSILINFMFENLHLHSFRKNSLL